MPKRNFKKIEHGVNTSATPATEHELSELRKARVGNGSRKTNQRQKADLRMNLACAGSERDKLWPDKRRGTICANSRQKLRWGGSIEPYAESSERLHSSKRGRQRQSFEPVIKYFQYDFFICDTGSRTIENLFDSGFQVFGMSHWLTGLQVDIRTPPR
jgi:hypothetical protein